MSEPPDKDEKTEEATEKRLKDALERGDAPLSQEAVLAAGIAAMLGAIAIVLPARAPDVAAALAAVLENPAGLRLEGGADAVTLAKFAALICAALVFPFVAPLMIMGILGTALQSQPRMVLSRLAPDFSRINIRSGLSRLFGQRGLTQFARSLIKLAVAAAAAVMGLRAWSARLASSMAADPGILPVTVLDQTVVAAMSVFLAILALAAADLAWARYHWLRDHKMSRQEVKEELRQSEGDPMLKGRLRALRMARSRKRMLGAVPQATLVVVNPTHYAIALRYRRNEDAAPVVVAKGLDLVALKIRSIAAESNIPLIEDKPLARSLYAAVDVDDCIPVEFYRVIAELIHFIESKRTLGAGAGENGAANK